MCVWTRAGTRLANGQTTDCLQECVCVCVWRGSMTDLARPLPKAPPPHPRTRRPNRQRRRSLERDSDAKPGTHEAETRPVWPGPAQQMRRGA